MSIALLLMLLTFPGMPQQDSKPAQAKKPSLAELAKKSKEGRSGTARLITNADLPSLSANVSTGMSRQGPEPSQAAETEPAPAEEPDTEAEIEALRTEFASARTNLETIVNQASVLELRMNALRNAYFQQSDGVTRERLQYELNQTYEAMQENEKQQKDANRAMQVLERRARDLGMTPGQIRELVGNTPKPRRIFEGTPGEPGQAPPEPPAGDDLR